VIICGLALFITKYTKSPPREVIKAITLATLLIPIGALLISINLKTARVYCTYEGSLPYKDSSSETQIAVLAYSLTVILPVYLCILLDSLFSILLFLRVRGLDAAETSGASNTTEKAQLNAMVIRMQLYPIIVILSWLPNSFLYILGNAYDIKPMFLRIAAVLTLATSGLAISLNYFYHQRTYPPFIHQLFGTSVDRQSMLHGAEIESSFGSWSEVESYSSSTTLPRGTTFSLPRGSGSSQPTSNTSTAERTYSMARRLLPRFEFRSHSSGGSPINLTTPHRSVGTSTHHTSEGRPS
jgi:hypothetical protein